MVHTRYSRPYPAPIEWEYKIVRARHFEFADRNHLRALLEQEALAGWTLVEVYNASQVRLRRPRSARQRDATLPRSVDPYRTVYTPAVSDENALLHLITLTVGVTLAIIVIAILGILLTLPG